jgi:hypothetical protein
MYIGNVAERSLFIGFLLPLSSVERTFPNLEQVNDEETNNKLFS